MKIPRTDADMIRTLQTEIRLLKAYYHKAFVEDDPDYLGEIAAKLRILLYEKGSNKALLLQLMDKFNMDIPVRFKKPLLQVHQGRPEVVDSMSLRRYLALNAGTIPVTDELICLPKIDLVVAWAQQLGGAHKDWEIEDKLFEVLSPSLMFSKIPLIGLELRDISRYVLEVADEFLGRLEKIT